MLSMAGLIMPCALSLAAQSLPQSIQDALDQWRAVHGTTWHVILDERTEMGRMLFNGAATGETDPQTDAERFTLAREFLADAHGILGIDTDTLVNDLVLFLPLGIVGTTDKITVRFRQEVDKVPVRGGWVNALLDSQDRLLCLDSDGLPYLSGFSVSPTVTADDARAIASSAFVQETGAPAASVSTPVLVIYPQTSNGVRTGVLAWEVQVCDSVDTADASVMRLYRVRGKLPGGVINSDSSIHDIAPQQHGEPVSGRVDASATLGENPDPTQFDWTQDLGSNDPPVNNLELVPMAYIYVKKAAGGAILTTTNGLGEFSLPAVLAGTDVVFQFDGPYVTVCGFGPTAGPNCVMHTISPTLMAGFNSIWMNPNYSELVTAQANCFYRINQMRDWIVAVNPLDRTLDTAAPFRARPNEPYTCMGQFVGNVASPYVRFSRIDPAPEPECDRNWAFSTIIWHEMGHWLNQLYGNGNGDPAAHGFGEGLADVWALYISDYHNVGNGPNRPGRSGTNALQFCGDCDKGDPPPEGCTNCQGCHGGSHENGKVLMGALWKVRESLKELNGDDLGAAIANSLFLSWLNAFDINSISSPIMYQWLVLDDPDGNLTTPTLNRDYIEAGFVAQGFPAVQLPVQRPDCAD